MSTTTCFTDVDTVWAQSWSSEEVNIYYALDAHQLIWYDRCTWDSAIEVFQVSLPQNSKFLHVELVCTFFHSLPEIPSFIFENISLILSKLTIFKLLFLLFLRLSSLLSSSAIVSFNRNFLSSLLYPSFSSLHRFYPTWQSNCSFL